MNSCRVISIDELCREYGVSKRWVYNTDDTVLPRVKFKGITLKPLRFDRAVVERLFQASPHSSLKREYADYLDHDRSNDSWRR